MFILRGIVAIVTMFGAVQMAFLYFAHDDPVTEITKTYALPFIDEPRERDDLNIVIERWVPPFNGIRCMLISLPQAEVNWYMKPLAFLYSGFVMGCVDPWELIESKKCRVITPLFWNEHNIEHEIRHCEGYAHDDDGDGILLVGPLG